MTTSLTATGPHAMVAWIMLNVPEPPPPTVYRCYAAGGKLLYVGKSCNICRRLSDHWSGSEWFQRVHTITLDYYEDAESAENAEVRAISEGCPENNVHHTSSGLEILRERMAYARSKLDFSTVKVGAKSQDLPPELMAEAKKRWIEDVTVSQANVAKEFGKSASWLYRRFGRRGMTTGRVNKRKT